MRFGGVEMSGITGKDRILIVDDEWESPIVSAVRRRLDEEGWSTITVEAQSQWQIGEELEAAAMYAIEDQMPSGVLLDVRLGEYKEDQFRGLEILQKIIERYPTLPVLMFTQYTQGPDRETAVKGTLKWNTPVDFIDKLASPEEVVLRLRRLIGTTPQIIPVGNSIYIDVEAKMVYVKTDQDQVAVNDIHGMTFEIFHDLASTWYRSPGELVPFSRLERYSDGEEARASLRVRIREIKVSLGRALGVKFGANDLVINVRDQGYRLVPPKN